MRVASSEPRIQNRLTFDVFVKGLLTFHSKDGSDIEMFSTTLIYDTPVDTNSSLESPRELYGISYYINCNVHSLKRLVCMFKRLVYLCTLLTH